MLSGGIHRRGSAERDRHHAIRSLVVTGCNVGARHTQRRAVDSVKRLLRCFTLLWKSVPSVVLRIDTKFHVTALESGRFTNKSQSGERLCMSVTRYRTVDNADGGVVFLLFARNIKLRKLSLSTYIPWYI